MNFQFETMVPMKSARTSCIGYIALFIGMFIVENNSAKMPSPEEFRVQTKNFVLNFEIGDDGRLYQRPVGAEDPTAKLLRDQEFYPQAGDGYVWEPALEVIHPQGLDPVKRYTIHELNPMPGRAAMEREGRTFTGEELMCDGIVPSCAHPVEACVIELGS
jgi:hypothetical protein